MDVLWKIPLSETEKKINIQISAPDDLMPWQADPGSSGVDLKADGNHVVNPGERKLIPTGVTLKMPIGCEGQVRPRSGLALKKGITVLNSPGTVDSSYTGIVGVILLNTSEEPFEIAHGDRIAQLVFCPIFQPVFEKVDVITADTERGSGGFGSTGVSS